MYTDKHLLCWQKFQYNSFTGAKNIATQAWWNMLQILMARIAQNARLKPLQEKPIKWYIRIVYMSRLLKKHVLVFKIQ